MPNLKENPTMADYQVYVERLEIERGFKDQSARDKCLLLGEEIGELFKAVRKVEGLKIDVSSQFGTVSEELADILIYVCAIANRYGIDLEVAFREKEAINHQRSWIEQGDLFAGFESELNDDEQEEVADAREPALEKGTD